MDLLQLHVVSIIPETASAVSILLEDDQGPIHYEAGQFLTLIFHDADRELRRSYSISSTPGLDPFLSITVKRVPNGEISRWLLKKVRKGDKLISVPPAGRFQILTNPSSSRQIFFIAAGSGIVPIFSLLKKLLAEEPNSHAVLIDQNHNEKNILFKGRLEKMVTQYGFRLQWINLLSKSKKRGIIPKRLTNHLLEELVHASRLPDLDTTFYLCGPPALMRMAQFTLRVMGFSDEQIRKEHFTIQAIPTAPPLLSDTEPKKIVLHHGGQTFRFSAAYPTSILQAALDNKVLLPYSCRAGSCASCVARLLSGKLKMSVNEVLTEKDLQEGLVLTCVGYAQTDIELTS